MRLLAAGSPVLSAPVLECCVVQPPLLHSPFDILNLVHASCRQRLAKERVGG